VRYLVSVIAVALFYALAFAGGPVPIDPRVILSDLAGPYRESPQVDEMRITVETATSKRIERMTVRTWPEEGAEIELGPLIIWTDFDAWYAAHNDVPGVFVRIPIEDDDVLGTLSQAFPPIVMPQIAWMLSDDPNEPLSTHTGKITWLSGSIHTSCRTAGPSEWANATGVAGEYSIEVRTDTQHRFDELALTDSQQGITITAERVDSHAPTKAAMGIDTSGREALASLGELLSRLREQPE